MEALEEDYGDGNGKNESRKFMEGLMDLALNRESIDWRQWLRNYKDNKIWSLLNKLFL